MYTSNCPTCGAIVVCIEMKDGRTMACDPEPIYYRESKRGQHKVVNRGGDYVRCFLLNPELADGEGYIPHWSTCQDVKQGIEKLLKTNFYKK